MYARAMELDQDSHSTLHNHTSVLHAVKHEHDGSRGHGFRRRERENDLLDADSETDDTEPESEQEAEGPGGEAAETAEAAARLREAALKLGIAVTDDLVREHARPSAGTGATYF
jgi:hypothetical protein